MDTEFEIYYRVQDDIYGRGENVDFDRLTAGEQMFFLVDWLDVQVHNGGWHQWYWNWEDHERAVRVNATLDALSKLKAGDTVLLMKKAVPILRSKAPPTHPRLVQFDEEFWERRDDLTQMMQDWVQAHPHQFRVPVR